MPRPKLPTIRTDRAVLPKRPTSEKSIVSSPRPLSLPADRKLRRQPDAERRPARPFGDDADLGRDDDVLDVGRVVAGELELVGQRCRLDRRDVQAVVEPAVHLQLEDRAEPEADAERRQAQQVAGQAGGRIDDVALRIEAAFDEDVAGADRFRILGDQRPLLRAVAGAASAEYKQRVERARCFISAPRAIMRSVQRLTQPQRHRPIVGLFGHDAGLFGHGVQPAIEQVARADVGERADHRVLDVGVLDFELGDQPLDRAAAAGSGRRRPGSSSR